MPPDIPKARRPDYAAGFLSPDIGQRIDQHRTTYAAWLAFGERLNATGQCVLSEVPITLAEGQATDPIFVAFLLLIRTMSNFQGTILMAERGMVVEARTLARSCIENAICVGALHRGEDAFVDRMLYGSLPAHKGKASFLLKQFGGLQFSGEALEKCLREHVDQLNRQWGALGSAKLEASVEEGGIRELYLAYRQLSGDAAHPSVAALSRYVVPDESGRSIRMLRAGPSMNPAEIAETLNMACGAVIAACAGVDDMIGGMTAGQSLAALRREYQVMNDR